LRDTQALLLQPVIRASPALARKPRSLVGLVDDDVDEVHAPPAVAGGEALSVRGEVEAEEGEVAIEAGDFPAAPPPTAACGRKSPTVLALGRQPRQADTEPERCITSGTGTDT
jgi:hypothetical protein